MRFNKQELFAIASQTSQNFDREGVLVLKEKQDGFFRRSEGYSARWFRLRGNLLFYLHDTEPLSEPMGVIVLGRHTIKTQPQDENGHWPFQIVWDNGVLYRMATFLESERTLWLKAIQSAPYDNLKTQIAALEEKLKKVPPTLDISAWRKKNGVIIDMNEIPLCEVALSCDNLVCDPHGRPPSPRVVLHVKYPRGQCVRYSNTETVYRCSNPSFSRTIQFRACDGLTGETVVRLIVYDVRERLSETAVAMGHTSLLLSAIQEAQRLRIALISNEKKTVGFITLNGWSLEPSHPGTSPNHTSDRNCIDIPQKLFTHRRSQSLPPRLGVKLKFPSSDAVMRANFANGHQVTYRLHSGLGGDITVQEVMAEPRLCFVLPAQLLDLFIQREKELLQELLSIGEMSGQWKIKQLELVHAHISLLKHYWHSKRSLLSVPEGIYFKQSSKKEEASLEFAPVNLHLQRMWVHNDTLSRAGFHDLVTVGAFSAHAHKSDTRGGLIRLVQQVKDISCTNAAFNSATVSKILTEYDNIITARHLRDQILQIVDKMCLLVQSRQDISTLLEMLISKTRVLLGLWDRGAIEEAMSFMTWHRAKDNSVTGINQPVSTIQHLSEQLTKFELLNADYDSLDASSSSSKATTPDTEVPLSASVPNIYNNKYNFILDCDLSFHNDYFRSETETPTVKLADTQLRSFERGNKRPDFKSSTSLEHVSYRSLTNSNKVTDERRESFTMARESRRDVTSQRPMTSELEEALAAVVDAIHSVTSGEDSCPEWSMSRLAATSESLRGCMEELLLRLGWHHATLRLRSEPVSFTRAHAALQIRRDTCFAQALTTATVGLLCWASSSPPDVVLGLLNTGLGPLCGFEGLLSLYLNEETMWGDMVVAIEDLQTVMFTFVKSAQCPNSMPVVGGSRGHVHVNIPISDSLYNKFTGKEQHLTFTVTAVFFNIGINKNATVAEALQETTPQHHSNCDNLERMHNYYQKYRKLFPPDLSVARSSSRSKPLEEVMENLRTAVHRRTPKNVEILHLAAQATRLMHGLRFTSCKSAKDRTGMSVTIEQTNILAREYHLAENEYEKAKEILRSEGCRRENTEKNIGVRKYAFNKRQVAALPDEYKPPPGTYGCTQT